MSVQCSSQIILLICLVVTSADYWEDREKLIREDLSAAVGSSIVLNEKEQEANRILMSYKLIEFNNGFVHPEKFLAAQHFFKSKDGIESSQVFKIIKQLPKAASLHSHDIALTSLTYVHNLTYWPNLYGCWKNKSLNLRFFLPNSTSKDCNWELLSDLRQANPRFDTILMSELSMIVKNPRTKYANVNKAWWSFTKALNTVIGLLTYRPVWEQYFYQALKELYEDNVRYLELRTVLPEMYDLRGNVYDGFQVVGICFKVVEKFKKDYPDFHGGRIIYAPRRHVGNKTVDQYVDLALRVHEKYPEFFAGFDMVGQEDVGFPLSEFIPQLLKLKQNGVKFFFHAGETKWNGESTDINLFDAILLNTTRIGHGYAIMKHPVLQKIVRDRSIAIEVSPISNQILNLVDDFRNHPASIMIASGFPVVITCDDPTVWDAKGLSYDWYIAFMALASEKDDLKLLKQLAINSIKFSAMKEDEKEGALEKWMLDWDMFIDKLVGSFPAVINV